MKEQDYNRRYIKQTKTFEDMLKDFMKKSDEIQKGASRRDNTGRRGRRGKPPVSRREDI